MHTRAANKALVNVSNIGCGTSAKTHPQKYKVAPGKAPCFAAVFLFRSTCRKIGYDKLNEHTRTLLRNAHLNTITVTKTCSNIFFQGFPPRRLPGPSKGENNGKHMGLVAESPAKENTSFPQEKSSSALSA